MKLIANSLFAFEKARKVTPQERGGQIYLHITPRRYLGSGASLQEAISDANARTFSTGWRVSEA